jgi:hypothetical protein
VAAPPARSLRPTKAGNQTARPPLPNLAAVSSNRSITGTLAAGNTTVQAGNTTSNGTARDDTGLQTAAANSSASPAPSSITSAVATRNSGAHAVPHAVAPALALLAALLVGGWR